MAEDNTYFDEMCMDWKWLFVSMSIKHNTCAQLCADVNHLYLGFLTKLKTQHRERAYLFPFTNLKDRITLY